MNDRSGACPPKPPASTNGTLVAVCGVPVFRDEHQARVVEHRGVPFLHLAQTIDKYAYVVGGATRNRLSDMGQDFLDDVSLRRTLPPVSSR